MNDHDIVLAIQELMDGVEWNADTLKEIAEMLNGNGYPIGDIKPHQLQWAEGVGEIGSGCWIDPSEDRSNV